MIILEVTFGQAWIIPEEMLPLLEKIQPVQEVSRNKWTLKPREPWRLSLVNSEHIVEEAAK